ncbi:MAG: hypothetical protein CMO11_04055 [Thaumarchaeota archaeon]|nr:hypothetical protein [Nitrososphaerota archaeon]|tara:strand:- start:982 stop:1317 length:336 start_codon:yes stop_codon:yes gene_type:complete
MSEENIPISGIACDMTGSITAFGKGAEELFGYTKDEVIGKGNVGMFHTEENVKTLVPVLLQTAIEKGVWEDEVELVRKDGSHFIARLNVKSLKDGDKPIGFMGTTHFVKDI